MTEIPLSKGKMKRNCEWCGKEIIIWKYKAHEKRSCCRSHSMLLRWKEGTAKGFKKGHTINVGRHFGPEFGLKHNKHPEWKGDKAGYVAIHQWLKRHFGKPDHCDICGNNKKKEASDKRNLYQWSNRTHIHTRDLQNWWQLCKFCHEKYDHNFLCDLK